MMSLPDALRLVVLEVGPIRKAYVESTALLARWHARRGRAFSSIEAAMRAWRADPDGFGNPKRDWCLGRIEDACYNSGQLAPSSANRFLAEYGAGKQARSIRAQFAAFPIADRVRLRYPRPESDPERQGDLIILKNPIDETGEMGVILIKYSEAFRRLPAVLDVARLGARFQLVLEPSWWGYQDATFLLYLGANLDAVIMAQREADYDFVASLESNLVPIRLGAGDWVDPGTFTSTITPLERRFDVVMVAGWSPAKRHSTLFRALRELRVRRNRTLQVALIGYPQGWERDRIESLMERFGVASHCTIFERIPPSQVAEIVGNARISVVLSKREGANKALYESLFCDTPVVLLKGQRGVNLDHITSDVGVFTEESALADTLLGVLNDLGRFHPRRWADANTGWPRSTETLNQCLKELALKRGRPWTTDIAPKKNAPNLKYAEAGAHRRFEAAYEELNALLR